MAVRSQKGFVSIDGRGRVIHLLEGLSPKGKKRVTCQVGFGAPYAVYVHEDLTKYHAPPTQAQFLLVTARRLEKFLAAMITSWVFSKRSLEEGVQRAGDHLLEETKKITPIKTGHLRRTGFARIK